MLHAIVMKAMISILFPQRVQINGSISKIFLSRRATRRARPSCSAGLGRNAGLSLEKEYSTDE